MSKIHSKYVCQSCGCESPRWIGKCPNCSEWNTFVEELVQKVSARKSVKGTSIKATPLNEVDIIEDQRLTTSIDEFDRVLGGGIVLGSVVLLGGDPGVGKSTLMMQLAAELKNSVVLYISGEESAKQIKLRAERLNFKSVDSFLVLAETNVDVIAEVIERTPPDVIIVDSIQTMFRPQFESSPGSVGQVRESTALFTRIAKDKSIPIFLIGHVTKEGVIAGPKVIEHMVDTVLQFEGERHYAYRILRAIKNRFGSTNEIGVFEMRERGLVEVLNPSEAFLAERMINAPGSCIAVTMEGTRPILVEIQGLTSPTQFGNARRTPNGVDFNRLLLIAAVLTRRMGLKLAEQDVFVNVVGGIQIDEPAADLAVAAAITSSWRDLPVRADTVLIGEIGLAGELRMPGQMQARLREAAKLGFKTAIVPKAIRTGEGWPKGIEIIEARSVQQALDAALVSPELPKGRKVA